MGAALIEYHMCFDKCNQKNLNQKTNKVSNYSLEVQKAVCLHTWCITMNKLKVFIKLTIN